MYRYLFFFFLYTSFSGCAFFDTTPPVLGQIVDGVYTEQNGRFSCSLMSGTLGLNDMPNITDARRIVRTEYIPLSQRTPGDARANKILSDEIKPAGSVEFHYTSGTIIEIISGKRFPKHKMESILRTGMTGGFTWPFDTREIESSMSHMMSLQLVPWYDERESYMGFNISSAYAQGQGPDTQLWIINNIANEDVHHSIIIRLLIAPILTVGVNPRNLSAVREDIRSRPELQSELFDQAKDWLSQCNFVKEIK